MRNLEDQKTISPQQYDLSREIARLVVKDRDAADKGFLTKIKNTFNFGPVNLKGIEKIEELAVLGLIMLADGTKPEGMENKYFTQEGSEVSNKALSQGLNESTLGRIKLFETFKDKCQEAGIFDAKEQSYEFVRFLKENNSREPASDSLLNASKSEINLSAEDVTEYIESWKNRPYKEESDLDDVLKKYINSDARNQYLYATRKITGAESGWRYWSTLFGVIMGAITYWWKQTNMSRDNELDQVASLDILKDVKLESLSQSKTYKLLF